jgi:hypothetical protein
LLPPFLLVFLVVLLSPLVATIDSCLCVHAVFFSKAV